MSRERRQADTAAEKKLKGLSAVAARLGGFKPAHQVLVQVRAVPTVFPWVNRISKVGGWPTARFTLLHGESGDGKTKFGLGLGASFLAGGHFFGHLDVEQTTSFDWPQQLFGPLADLPTYLALRASSYEAVRAEIRNFCEGIRRERLAGNLEPGTTGFLLLDSIRKLVPDKIWDELRKAMKADAEPKPTARASKGGGSRWSKKPKGVDGYGGRAAQYKAALNAALMDEIVPLLAETDCALACIARETIDDEGDVKIGGGKALFYDSSLVARVERDCFITNGQKPSEGEVIYGERHAVVVHKTKIAGREERWPTAYFHSSNGLLPGVPAGFDRPRDLLELALSLGVVEQKGGGHLSLGAKALGQGGNKVVQRLHAEPELLALLERGVESIAEQPKLPAQAQPSAG